MLKKCIAVLMLLPTLVFAETFEAGKDYAIIPNQSEQSSHEKPQILEFFNYGCPACFRVDAPLEVWIKKKGNTIDFEKIPVAFNKAWENYARAWYIAKNLSMTDKISPILFKAIHVEKKTLDTPAMINLFVRQGADKSVVTSAFEHSLTIDMAVKNGMTQMAGYQISVIPSFVVNQRYRTDAQMAETPERLMKILDYLLTLDPKAK